MKLKTRIFLIVLAAVLAVACFITACTTITPNKPPENPPEEEEPIKPTIPPSSGIATPEDFKNITIYGADDAEIIQGTYFDCFEGVSAVADTGKNVSSHLKVSGNLNTAKAGTYNVLYYVFYGRGNVVEKTRKLPL